MGLGGSPKEQEKNLGTDPNRIFPTLTRANCKAVEGGSFKGFTVHAQARWGDLPIIMTNTRGLAQTEFFFNLGKRLSDPYLAFFLPIATTSNKNF